MRSMLEQMDLSRRFYANSRSLQNILDVLYLYSRKVTFQLPLEGANFLKMHIMSQSVHDC